MIKQIKKKFNFWLRERMFYYLGKSVHHSKWVIVIQLYIDHADQITRDQILCWLDETCQGSFSYGPIYVVNPHFFFAQKEDAALFKLTWSGQ